MWEIDNNQLYKDFSFKNFREAFKFMEAVAELAEQQQHHQNGRMNGIRSVFGCLHTKLVILLPTKIIILLRQLTQLITD